VVIVGSGFAGIGMAIKLKQAGRHDFVVLEKADDLGGTWRDNTYPGAVCDVQSHLYSYSFELNPSWTRLYAPQQEIWDYLRHCADKYGVTPHIRFGSTVTAARYDQGRRTWRIEIDGQDDMTAGVVVSAVGALHLPNVPNLSGADRFAGPAFHSAQWRHDVDLKGLRVAVVGTGASAIQFVPEVAKTAAHVDVYQRSAPWVLPSANRDISPRARRIFTRLPGAQRFVRTGIYWYRELFTLGFVYFPRFMSKAEAIASRHLARKVADPELRAKLTPDYQIGCKRVLISDDYYPTLQQPHVELVTDPIEEVTATGIRTRDGADRPADVIVFGTGFVVSGNMRGIEVAGRDGRVLSEEWKRDGENAYLGLVVAGFPNFFMLVGPNTGLGHTSMVFMIEAQIGFVLRALRLIDKGDDVEIPRDVQLAFADDLQDTLDQTVWNSGCTSWYLDEHGRNIAIWPGFTWQYWWQTRWFWLKRWFSRRGFAMVPPVPEEPDQHQRGAEQVEGVQTPNRPGRQAHDVDRVDDVADVGQGELPDAVRT
jgi:cation diffusion facilitator CzcD-associated flavoprotein CzcO